MCRCEDSWCSARQTYIKTHPMQAYAAPSKIAGAGKGLFAAHALKRGEFITIYSGTVSQQPLSGSRVLDFGRGWCVDAKSACTHKLARGDLINHQKEKQNCRYKYLNSTLHLISVVATRPVLKDEELYSNYGPYFQF